jgi:hypothetical protein
LVKNLKNNQKKYIVDTKMNIHKIKLKAHLTIDFYTLFDGKTCIFVENLVEFMKGWIHNYAISNTLIENK